jgi:hypothetical protein
MKAVDFFERDPDDTYKAYQKFRKRNEPEKPTVVLRASSAFPGRYGAFGRYGGLDHRSNGRREPCPTVVDAPDQAGFLLAGLCPLSEIEAMRWKLDKRPRRISLLPPSCKDANAFSMDSPQEARKALDRAGI